MKNSRLFLYLFILGLMHSCTPEKKEEFTIDYGYSYVPLAIGQVIFYQVDSIIYDDFTGGIDTISFQQKEELSASFVDGTARKAFRIEISERLNDTSAWRIVRREVRLRTGLRYETQEDNVREIRLVFPVEENKRWDANALNAANKQEYEYESVHGFFEFGNLQFDSSLHVIQRDEENLIERFYTEERYASGKGLIYRRDINLRTKLNGEIEKGFVYTKYFLRSTP